MRKLTLPSIIALLAISASASAADGWGPGYAYADFDITTQVEAECSFEVHDTHLVLDDPGAPAQITESNIWVDVHCSNGIPFEIAMNRGLTGERRLVGLNDPTKQMRYEMYLPAPNGHAIWGDMTPGGGFVYGASGTGENQQLVGTIRFLTGWHADNMGEPYLFPADTYQDTITATLTY